MLDGSSTLACANFCDSSFTALHCSFCACATCLFCPTRVSIASLVESAAPLPAATPPPPVISCSSKQSGDVSEPMCQGWCAQTKHCAFCKCSACKMCEDLSSSQAVAQPLPSFPSTMPASLSQSASTTDKASANHTACSKRCHAQHCNVGRSTDCDTCTCQGCPFCQVLGKEEHVGSIVPQPMALTSCSWLQSLRDLRAKGSFCYELRNTDRLTYAA